MSCISPTFSPSALAVPLPTTANAARDWHEVPQAETHKYLEKKRASVSWQLLLRLQTAVLGSTLFHLMVFPF
jgi:hypothetical protein